LIGAAFLFRAARRPCSGPGKLACTFGKPAAVLLVPYDDDDLERLMLARSPRFQAMLDRSRQSIKQGKGLSEKAFWEAVRKRAQERKAAAAKGRRTAKRRLKSRRRTSES
jgi:hypothetical protein